MVPPLRAFGEPRLRRASRLRREPHGFAGCLECRHQVEPAEASLRAAEGGTSADPVEMARRYGPETPVPEWQKRLVCSQCGSHDTDMVVTGTCAPAWHEVTRCGERR
jgi:hypothetical protein